jgi:acyl-coenzyme A synthetase/AMP-(fatty) acid ligase
VPEELKAGIKKAVKDNITPYAIPTEIIAVPGTLKTPNGKIAEVVMKKIVGGKSIPNASLYGEDLVKNFEKIGEELNKKYGG